MLHNFIYGLFTIWSFEAERNSCFLTPTTVYCFSSRNKLLWILSEVPFIWLQCCQQSASNKWNHLHSGLQTVWIRGSIWVPFGRSITTNKSIGIFLGYLHPKCVPGFSWFSNFIRRVYYILYFIQFYYFPFASYKTVVITDYCRSHCYQHTETENKTNL